MSIRCKKESSVGRGVVGAATLPSLTALSVTIDAMKRAREEAPPSLPPPLPLVSPDTIIDTFVREYNTAYENVKASNLGQTDKETFFTQSKKTVELRLQKAEESKSAAEHTVQDIRTRGEYYTSDEGKAARLKDPSLKLTNEQKQEERRRFNEATRVVATERKRIIELQTALEELPGRVDSLFSYLDLMKMPDYVWFTTAIPVLIKAASIWYKPSKPFVEGFINVLPYKSRQFRLKENGWLKDLYFQRKLLSLLHGAYPTVTSSKAIIFGDQDSFEIGVSALEMAIAITVAVRRVKETYEGQKISSKPDPDQLSKHKLLGWDVDLGLKDLEEREESDGAKSEGESESPPKLKKEWQEAFDYFRKFMPNLIRRLVDERGYTRRLAIVIDTGDTGARSLVAKHSCIEFGIGAQVCSNITEALKHLNKTEMLKDLLYPKYIQASRGKEDDIKRFQQNRRKVGLIGWGHHARVIFKVGDGCAIVDPWRPAERVHVPKAIEDAFRSKPVWVDREPEQCGESSCSVIAMVRAVIICIAAHKAAAEEAMSEADALNAAAKSDMLDTEVHGPVAILLVRFAQLAVIGQKDLAELAISAPMM